MSTDLSNQNSVVVHFMFYKEVQDELHELNEKLDNA